MSIVRKVGIGITTLIILICCVLKTDTSAVTSNTGSLQYLAKYGYLPAIDPTRERMISAETVSSAISNFQSFMGLNVTGIMDAQTSHQMSLPRCGVKDHDEEQKSTRSKRFILSGSRWKIKDLTYKIGNYPGHRSNRTSVDQIISRAFALWSEHTDLTFTKQTGEVHIELRFERGWHDGDNDPFDGRGGTLAHACFPVYGGDVHFDKDELWTANSRHGTNLFQVAVHEIGHALGLKHSNVPTAVMFPMYAGYNSNFMLDADDIAGIQSIYGTNTRNEEPPICFDSNVDTILQYPGGRLYAFKGEYYWELTSYGIAGGYRYRKLITTKWAELPSDIDAAFTYLNGKTYFFKGSQYWRYIGSQMDGDYPMEISEGFPGIPDNIDTATVWTGNRAIYFYKGTQFWKFDPALRPAVPNSYPKPISNWEGLPNDLDAAVPIYGYTYFFKGGRYYRFNDREFEVASTGLAFSGENKWDGIFGCR